MVFVPRFDPTDRLTHHADITVIEGHSHRQRESQLEATARGKSRKQ